MKKNSTLLMEWVFANVVAGLLIGAVAVITQFGQLIAAGPIFGVLQWIVLRKYLDNVGKWFIVTTAGFLLGTILPLGITVLRGVGYQILPWIIGGVFQFMIIRQNLIKSKKKFSLLWIGVSTIGGFVYYPSMSMFNSIFQVINLSESTNGLLNYMFGSFVFGIISAFVLLWLINKNVLKNATKEIQEAQHKNQHKKIWIMLVIIAIAALVIVFGVRDTCSKEEKEVLAEFPHFGGVQLTLIDWGETGGWCHA